MSMMLLITSHRIVLCHVALVNKEVENLYNTGETKRLFPHPQQPTANPFPHIT